MSLKRFAPWILALVAVSASADAHRDERPTVVLDEDIWVTFYDLPSRRFRAIRAAILRRDHTSAARDLEVTANYLAIEGDRASGTFDAPLRDVADRLRGMRDDIDAIALDELDSLFGRAHWLLAQHYLEMARRARDAGNARSAGLDLWATTHHLERAILWSGSPITREVYATLEGLREAAQRLQDPAASARALRDKPLLRADRLLRNVGDQIDRRVLLAPPAGAAKRPGENRPGER